MVVLSAFLLSLRKVGFLLMVVSFAPAAAISRQMTTRARCGHRIFQHLGFAVPLTAHRPATRQIWGGRSEITMMVSNLPRQHVIRFLSSSTNDNDLFRGPMQAFVEKSVAEEFAPVTHLEVINESHGRLEDESHFKVVVVSEAFEGKRPLQRHRAVNAAIVDRSPSQDGALPFHSLTIVAKTPTQWKESRAVPDSPQCAGGDGSGLLR
jgi:stress-induced morphogen